MKILVSCSLNLHVGFVIPTANTVNIEALLFVLKEPFITTKCKIIHTRVRNPPPINFQIELASYLLSQTAHQCGV